MFNSMLVSGINIWPQAQPCRYVNDRDPTISRRHLMLRCVQFDEDAARWNVAPMVYVEDLSMNGTILVREYPDEGGSTVQFDHQLTKSMGPVLLQDGDCLYLSNSTYVQYRELDPKQENEDDISFVTSCEAQVSQDTYFAARRVFAHSVSASRKVSSLSLDSLVLVVKAKYSSLGTRQLVSKWRAKWYLWLAQTSIVNLSERHPRSALEKLQLNIRQVANPKCNQPNFCARYIIWRLNMTFSRT